MNHVDHRWLNVAIYFTSFWLLVLTALFVFRWLLRRPTYREAQFCLFAAVSLVSAVMLSLSFPIFESMTLPGLALLLAACLQGAGKWQLPFVYAACSVLVVSGTLTKLDIPFSFDSFSEPHVLAADSVSSRPELRGFVLPKEIVKFVDETLVTIQANTSKRDTIFTYPELVAFYALSGKWCPTFTCSHNIDVVNDAFARQEAQRLLAHPPAVLIYVPEGESALHSAELLWRHGAKSGNRDIINAVKLLASKYQLKNRYKLPPDGNEVLVYVRPSNFVLQEQ